MAQQTEGSDQVGAQPASDNTIAFNLTSMPAEDVTRGYTQLASLQSTEMPGSFTSSDALLKGMFEDKGDNVQLASAPANEDPNAAPGLNRIQQRPLPLQPGNIGRNIYGTQPIHTPGESNDTEHFGPRRNSPYTPKYRIV
jgi:hypothetical protein